MKSNELPSFEVLWMLFVYAPLTGKLYYRIARTNKTKIGDEAGCVNPLGYRQVGIGTTTYLAHRIVYKMMTGKEPGQCDIDHKDRNKEDNRSWNLRLDTEGRNPQNRKLSKNNKSGVTGVVWKKHARQWCSSIVCKGKLIHIGYFKDLDNAIEARRKAELKYFGEWAPTHKNTSLSTT
jgi:hypothetical protein